MQKTELVAEVGLSHDGSLGIAHSYLDICSSLGIDTIKFQMHIAEAESSLKENFRIPVMTYQVSGEYSLLSNGIKQGLIDKNVVLESLIAFKRAGANAIVSYYADKLDNFLK